MSDAHKQLSLSDLALPPKRGRPVSGNALPNKEKQRLYRERKKKDGVVTGTLNHEELSIIQALLVGLITDEAWRFDAVRKHHGTQLQKLSEKIGSMNRSAEQKAYAAITGKKK